MNVDDFSIIEAIFIILLVIMQINLLFYLNQEFYYF